MCVRCEYAKLKQENQQLLEQLGRLYDANRQQSQKLFFLRLKYENLRRTAEEVANDSGVRWFHGQLELIRVLAANEKAPC